jgi:hypothetical protein
MALRGPRHLVHDQSGLTLVELLAGLGVASLIMTFVGAAVFQFFRVVNQGNDRLLLVSDLQPAAAWLGRDAAQSSTFTPGSLPDYGSFTIPNSSGSVLIRYSYDSASQALVRTEVASGDRVLVTHDVTSSSDISFRLLGNILTVHIASHRGDQTYSGDLKFNLRVP